MISIPDRLLVIYKQVIKSNLILTNIHSEENINKIQSLLNESVHTHAEYKLFKFIKELSKNKELFYKFLDDYNSYELILWAELDIFKDYLNISDVIDIKPVYRFFKSYKKLIKYNVSKSVIKKMNIADILTRFDNKKNKVIEPKLNFDELYDYEAEYQESHTKLWDRRNRLRDEMNKNI